MDITSAAAMTTAQVLAATATPAEPARQLTEQFSSLMSRAADVSASQTGEASPVAQALLHQDTAMRSQIQSLQDLGNARTEGTLSEDELKQRELEMHFKIATVQFQFNACIYVAQSSKNGLQTLIKNQ